MIELLRTTELTAENYETTEVPQLFNSGLTLEKYDSFTHLFYKFKHLPKTNSYMYFSTT